MLILDSIDTVLWAKFSCLQCLDTVGWTTAIISSFIKIQIGLTCLVPAYPDCPGKEAVKLTFVFWIDEPTCIPSTNAGLCEVWGQNFLYSRLFTEPSFIDFLQVGSGPLNENHWG